MPRRRPARLRDAASPWAPPSGRRSSGSSDVQERWALSSARNATQGERDTQASMAALVAFGAVGQRRQATDALRPFQGVEAILDREEGGCVEGLALEDAFDQPAILGQAENWAAATMACGSPGALMARGLSAIMRCWASLPSAFCHDQVVTSSLSQGSAMAEGARGRKTIARPHGCGAMQSASGTRTPEVGAVPGEDTFVLGRGLRQVGQATVKRLEQAGNVSSVEPGLRCRWPRSRRVSSEANTVAAARPQQGPQAEFHCAGVGGRHDATPGSCWDAEHARDGRWPRRALPAGQRERCERPSTAPSRFCNDQPGRLAQGPEEKQLLAGFKTWLDAYLRTDGGARRPRQTI